MRKVYPSDVTQEQFAVILPILEQARKKTRPRAVDLYEIFCGVSYVLKSGCQWRMLPSDFPKWRTCYSYFQIWSEPHEEGIGLLEAALKKSGWRGETKQWSDRAHQLPHRRCAKREEHRHGGRKRL